MHEDKLSAYKIHVSIVYIMHSSSVHHYINDFFIVEAYHLVYAEAISPILDNDKPTNDTFELILYLPISKRQPKHPRKKWIESQSFVGRDSNYCHEAGHNYRYCSAPIVD